MLADEVRLVGLPERGAPDIGDGRCCTAKADLGGVFGDFGFGSGSSGFGGFREKRIWPFKICLPLFLMLPMDLVLRIR